MQDTRSALRGLAVGLLVVISLWNVWGFDRAMSDFPPREQESVFIREGRYVHLRNALLEAKYDGVYIGFITVMLLPPSLSSRLAWGTRSGTGFGLCSFLAFVFRRPMFTLDETNRPSS